MGGSFFASGHDALSTPRMPPQVYHETKARIHHDLLGLYLCVASPIDGPAKTSFGDIDIVLAWNRHDILGLPPPGTGDEFLEIGRVLGAQRTICENGARAAHYAIPWPSHLLHLATQDGDGGEQHIQVDVRICESLPAFQWALFKHSHGDLWNIVGSTIRPLGLTVDDAALWIRVPEIEAINRSRAKVKVTDDPVQVLKVLGLEMGRHWEEPFATLDEMYEYTATSPLFWVRPLEDGSDEARVSDYKRSLKSNDRRRMAMRPCYRGWVEDFLPRCRRENRFTTQRHTRASVTSLIFSSFPVEEEFEARLRDFEIEQQRNDIWKNKIKGFVDGLGIEDSPRGQMYRGCLIKAMKQIVLEGDERYGVLPRERMKGDDGRYIMGNVVEFIERKYKAVGEAAMRVNNEAYVERMRGGLVEETRKKKTEAEGQGESSG